jgi:hypothetical protein
MDNLFGLPGTVGLRICQKPWQALPTDCRLQLVPVAGAGFDFKQLSLALEWAYHQ